ncbi:MAG: VWA domain-containing protein [Fervidicoccaceae archaeon]
MTELQNLLLNITNKDYIYNVISKLIISLLPEDLASQASKNERLTLLSTDAFFLHYSAHPMLSDHNNDELLENARLIFYRYMTSNDFMKARASTVLDEHTSLIFSTVFLRKLIESLTTSVSEGKGGRGELEGPGKGKRPQLQEQENGGKSEKKDVMSGQAAPQDQKEKEGEIQIEEKLADRETAERAMAQALSQASAYTSRAKQLKDIGFSGGASREKGDVRRLLDLTELIMQVREAQEIIDLLQKLTDVFPKTVHMKKETSLHGEEIGGYRRTKKIERALPREFSLPRDLFISKYYGEGLISLEKEISKKGILYVLLDKSGSMSGHKLIWSRSIALFFIRLAYMRGMSVFMRMFDSEPYPYNNPMSSFPSMIEAVLKIASNGGTDIKKAMGVALEDVGKQMRNNRAFIFLITDGEDKFTMRRDTSWKNIYLITVMVSGDNDVLKSLSDLYLKAGLTIDGALSIAKEGEKLITAAERSKFTHA